MFRKTGLFIPLLLALLAACSQAPIPEVGGPSELAPMFGSTSRDQAQGLAKHSSGVYVVGTVGPNIFVRKSDASGNVLWDKYIFGSANVRGVASDALDNAYVLGTNYANDDRGVILIRKYTVAGNVAWTRQLSTNTYVQANGIAADGSGNVYLLGYRNGSSFLSKYSTSGTRVWTRHGTGGSDVAVDFSGNIYVAGSTAGVVGYGSNMSIRKFSPSGGLLWTQQVLYKWGYGTAVAVSGNHVYLVGNYLWHEQTGEIKVAVTKYSADGVRQWSRPYGLYGSDYAWDASADGDGNLYFAGYRYGGPHSHYVGYVAKFSPDFNGRELWTKFIDAPEVYTNNLAVLARTVKGGVIGRSVVDPGPIFGTVTEVYAAGYTFGDLGAGNSGNGDAYLRRLTGTDGGTVWTK